MVDIKDGIKSTGEKHVKDQVAEIKKVTADTESIDLRNLLDLGEAIAEKVIEDHDKEVGAGAAPCMLEQLKRTPKQLPIRKGKPR